MKMTRQLRSLTACILLISVMFTQLAVAGYVCPSDRMAITTVMASQSAAMMANADQQSMPGCEYMDKSLPSLCHAHTQVGNQSLDKPELPPLPPFHAAALTLIVSDLAVLDFSIDNHLQSSPLLARNTTPPLSIRHCCFRI